MNYQVRRHGVELGVFSLEELRQRHANREFSGDEYVQLEGSPDWQPLGLVLEKGYRTTPPPLPGAPSTGGPNFYLIGGIVVLAVIFFAFLIFMFVQGVRRGIAIASRQTSSRYLNVPRPEAVAVASKPIVWTTNSLTADEVRQRDEKFWNRQWLDGYEKRGQRNPECDAKVEQFIRVWIANEPTNKEWLQSESEKIAADSNCTDPLAMTIIANSSINWFQARDRLQRAVDAFPLSEHKAYPKFFATASLAPYFPDRVASLDKSALQLLRLCFADGSFTPDDQQEIADIFVNNWGYQFFERNASAICKIAHQAGPQYQWLALVLDGENEISEAWAARGGGYANSVTEAGWRGFREHSSAARSALTEAWNLRPDYPLAPCRMIYVSLGDSDIAEMRQWFDRTTAAQIDYSRAWRDLRWGLRPRWYGNEAAILALGKAGLDTGRFDSDAPREYLESVYDVESEMGLPAGSHVFGRSDIWPNLKKMYDGYIAEPQTPYRDGWRNSYAIAAYFAGHYDIARAQLEALDWKPQNLNGWSIDLSLMPLEVAARTGSLGKKITTAEADRDRGNISSALKIYSGLSNAPDTDERTKKFIQIRATQLAEQQRLQKGEWISLLPSSDDDPNWNFSFGQAHCLPDGALEVEYGPKGHMLFSRTPMGNNFEVRGSFEVVRSSNKDFQGGIVMGVPDFDSYNWYGFRLKRHAEEGDEVAFSRGWSRQQIATTVSLNDTSNSFDLIFQNGKITATVNGIQILRQAAPPIALGMPHNSYLLGLGAFSDSDDTVIRYRNVRARKL